jgi:hypothetical protein
MGRAALEAEIDAVLATFTDEQRAEPLFFPDAYDSWTEFFRRRYERELAAYDGPPPPPARNNAAGRRRWWSAPDRTLSNVLAHIEGGNFPVLQMPPPEAATLSRRRGTSWLPRRMAPSSSSSGSASRSGGSTSVFVKKEPASPSTPARVKKELTSPPPTRGRSSGALVIRDQPSSPSSEFAVLRQNTYIHPGLAAGKMDLPGPNISSNPDENIAGFGRGQPKRVEML